MLDNLDDHGTGIATAAPLSEDDVARNTGIARPVDDSEFAATVVASTARSVVDELRVAAMLRLRQVKQRLIDLLEQRTAILLASYRDQERRAGSPSPAGAGAPRGAALLDDASERIPNAFERAVDGLWSEVVPLLDTIRTAVGYAQRPPPIGDHVTLGAQLNYLDDLWNAVSQSTGHATAEADTTPPVGSAVP